MKNNPQLFTPNYQPILNNANQQIQQPQVRPQKQVYPNNQVFYQNQQNQNIHNQKLYQQQIPQAQNNPQYMKQIQLMQNAQKQYIQNPKNQPNIMAGQGLPKTYPQTQIPNNMANQYKLNNANPTVPQKVQHQQIQNQQPTLNPKDKAKLATSHLNLSKTANLEPVTQNQPTHLIIQQKQQQMHQHHHHQQQPHQHHHQQAAQQQNPKTKVEENITNTVAMIPPQPIQNQNQPQEKLKTAQPNTKKSATFMTVKSLANLPYNEYPQAEYSSHSINNIAGYGSNSYNGFAKNYNEDMLKVEFKEAGISYFGIFDGHGGDTCSKFLKKNMHTYLFNSSHFPNNPIEATRDAFKTAETEFKKIAIQNNKLVDKSGSCAVMALIINNLIYAINLGDSRALYSRKGGQEFYQITRDHKPNDPKEKARIEKAGGKVFYANFQMVNGQKVVLKEEQFGPGFTFPWRLLPSGLAVSFYILINLGRKNYWRLLFKNERIWRKRRNKCCKSMYQSYSARW